MLKQELLLYYYYYYYYCAFRIWKIPTFPSRFLACFDQWCPRKKCKQYIFYFHTWFVHKILYKNQMCENLTFYLSRKRKTCILKVQIYMCINIYKISNYISDDIFPAFFYLFFNYFSIHINTKWTELHSHPNENKVSTFSVTEW